MFKNSGTNKIILIVSIITTGLWGLGRIINVYRFAIVGVIFEILWLPLLGLIFVLPILSMILWAKERFNLRSFYFYSILITVSAILIMAFCNPPR
jgi:hypothetical protein